MPIAEWIIPGDFGLLSFILLIVWLRWVGPWEGQKRDEPPDEVPKEKERLSSFAADRWRDKRSNKYEGELEALQVRRKQQPPAPRRRLRL